uniref:Putative mannosyltransferase n=1 Tax=Marseillevirus LCMAC202 TaxID=2506606 RepID=A0A481YZI4_9VIRU|nr:MAG: putative mannosyltransferase [Marseillevirus LCMAC202]
MSSTNDLLTMLYWVIGMVLVIFIIDWFWFKPYQEHNQTDRIIQRLRQKNRVFYQTLPKFNGRGIVIVLNDTTVLAGSLLILTMRRNLCKTPILVCYAGDDLAEQNRKFLESIQNVATMALGPKLDLPLETLRGTQARVYALIYSPFQEVLMLEPDMLFFKNPEYLFGDSQYRQTGALFWKDRKIQSYWDKKVYDWVRRLIPYRKGDNRILDKKAGNYQSQDLMLFNKTTHMKTLEKLWILTKEWETVYNYIPGDKESYWISSELAKEEHAFVPSYPGVIGELHMDTLCGHTLYLDSSAQLLGWNGSLFHNGETRQVTDFTHYALFDREAEWNKVLGGCSCSNKCLKNTEYLELSGELRGIINEYARILHDLKNLLVTKSQNDDGTEE